MSEEVSERLEQREPSGARVETDSEQSGNWKWPKSTEQFSTEEPRPELWLNGDFFFDCSSVITRTSTTSRHPPHTTSLDGQLHTTSHLPAVHPHPHPFVSLERLMFAPLFVQPLGYLD